MDIVKTAQELYKRDKEALSDIYKKAKEDLHFLSDDEFAQWDERDAQRRAETGRPALTIDQLGQFVHQVANDVRMNTPTINIIPSDSAANSSTAEKIKGKIRDIEYKSQADTAYDTAVTSAIKCSIGYIRIDHQYVDDKTLNQELRIKRVVNPFSIYLDSNSVEVDGSDAKHGTIIEEITVGEFKRRFPKKEVSSFGEEEKQRSDDDKVFIAEFFILEETLKEIGATEEGEVEDVVEGKNYTTKRKISQTKVRRYTLSAKDILEETTFPGKYIPIVPVYGEEAWENGKRHLHSLIRKSKSAQRMFNLWKSLETELLMKAPKAPIIAAAGSVEEYQSDWLDPDKAMVLRYNPTDVDGNPIPAPARLEPPTIPTGVVNASRQSVDDIKATMGLYNASLGAKSNETSGVAINQRKLEGDVATYHFGDNLVKSITQCGRILVSAFPEVYDTQRIERIIDDEDETHSIGINGARVDGQEEDYSFTEGQYDVRVVTGASFTTKRQETAAALQEVFKGSPELFSVMGDLFFKNSDFSGSQAMADRMKKVIDPKFLEEEEQDQEKLELQRALASTQQQLMVMQQQLQDKTQSEKTKIQLELLKIQQQSQEAQAEGQAQQMETQLKMAEIRLKEKELAIKELELQARLSQPPEWQSSQV